MKGLLFLLFSVEVLAAVQGGNQTTPGSTDLSSALYTNSPSPARQTPAPTDPSTVASTTTPSPTTISTPLPDQQPTSTTSTTSTPSTPTPFDRYRKDCLPVLMAAGGLIIACVFLLASTVLLMWKVCQLNRHIKMLSDNADLISTTQYWMGTAKKDKNEAEAESKENTMLMADIGQAQEEVGNGTTKVNKDGQTGEEDKKKDEDTTKSEQASATTENTPKEEATDSQSTKTSSAETTEEPKEVV